MCRTLEMLSLKKRGWLSEKSDRLGWHVHPYSLTDDDWQRTGSIGPWIVTQFWRTEWSGIRDTTAKALVEGAAKHKRKLVVRVEDPSVFGSHEKGDGRHTDDKWLAENYIPFLTNVVERVEGKAWGIQVFNEPNVRHKYVTGPLGGRISAYDMMRLVVRVQDYLEDMDSKLKVLMPGTIEYTTNQVYVEEMWAAGYRQEVGYDGPLNLHIYAGKTSGMERKYDRLASLVGNREVIVTEANGYWDESAEWRWLSIQNILRIVKERFNLIGFLIYCWQEPPYQAEYGAKWGQKGTEVEDWLRGVSTYKDAS